MPTAKDLNRTDPLVQGNQNFIPFTCHPSSWYVNDDRLQGVAPSRSTDVLQESSEMQKETAGLKIKRSRRFTEMFRLMDVGMTF